MNMLMNILSALSARREELEQELQAVEEDIALYAEAGMAGHLKDASAYAEQLRKELTRYAEEEQRR